jgi:predicted RNA polymerase sigma factor
MGEARCVGRADTNGSSEMKYLMLIYGNAYSPDGGRSDASPDRRGARRPARTSGDGSLVPLAEQDRSRWDSARIAEGVALISKALPCGEVGPYQLQAAIAAVHDEARSMPDTDWPQILGLYDLLIRVAPNPVTALNRAVAVAEVRGPAAGLIELAALESDQCMSGHHRLLAVRAHMLEQAGDSAGATAAYREAAKRAPSLPERAHLASRAARLVG